MEEHKTFKEFNDSKRPLGRSQYSNMLEGREISALVPKSYKKLFISGVILPKKKRFCKECNGKMFCNRCNIQLNENKEHKAGNNGFFNQTVKLNFEKYSSLSNINLH